MRRSPRHQVLRHRAPSGAIASRAFERRACDVRSDVDCLLGAAGFEHTESNRTLS